MMFDVALDENRLIDCMEDSYTNGSTCSKTKHLYGSKMQLCYEVNFIVQQGGISLLQSAPRFYKASLNLRQLEEAIALEDRPGEDPATPKFQINIDNELANVANTFQYEFGMGSTSTVSISLTKLKMLSSPREPCTQADTQVQCTIKCVQTHFFTKLFECQMYVNENLFVL